MGDTGIELKTPILTQEQIDRFKDDGFVLVPGAFDKTAVRRFQRWGQELCELPERPGRHWVYHEQSRLDPTQALISRIENISPFHPGFASVANVLQSAVAGLLGEPVLLFKEKINFKMPGGDGFKPHQDSQAGWEAYASYFVTAVVSIDQSTEANGCLKVALGQQHRPLFREWEPLTETDMADMHFVPCPMRPGDMAFLDTYAPHASEPNLTDVTRRLYFATFNRASEGDHLSRYYGDKRRSYPPDIERDPDKSYVFRV
jgi:hypothetical protein